MFVENRYPLAKEVLSQMLELKLETEEESSMALELIKFVKQQLEEFEDSNDDDSVTSDQEEAERLKWFSVDPWTTPFLVAKELTTPELMANWTYNMEDTMLDLLKICQQKELYCIHNNVDDLIESALNSKLLSINLNSQHLDKEKQEVKNIAEPATKRRTRITESL
ncbi:hypothetical protein Tco_0217674 [Tanacetum coccineum]